MSPAPAATRAKRTTAPASSRRLSSVRPPRRVSGPAPGRRTPQPPARQLPRPLLWTARAVARLVRHPLTDRVISGRWSIAVIAFALIGIVTLQLGLLKLNVGVGQALERERTLERENATLGIENAELASPERIRQLASRLNMSPVSLTQLRFLKAIHGVGTSAGAAARLHSPVHPASETQATSKTEAASAESTGSEAAGSEATSSEATSSEATSTEAASTEAASTEAAGSESASTEAAPESGASEASASSSSETGEGG